MKNNVTKEYQWNQHFRVPIAHTDINLIVSELETIKEVRGKVTPVLLVESAKNKKSIFHSYFQWNDSIAANEYRIEQARKLLRHIEIKVISNGETKISRAYEVITDSEISNEYKNVNLLTEDNMEIIKKFALMDLERVRKKLDFYDDYKEAVKFISLAMDILSKEKVKPLPKLFEAV